jgi:hypothetical protein
VPNVRLVGVLGLTAVIVAVVSLAGCGGFSGGSDTLNPQAVLKGAATVRGYVGTPQPVVAGGTAQTLQFTGEFAANPVEFATVQLTAGKTKIEVRTAADGAFAAQVPAGAVSLQAIPPVDASGLSASAPLTLNAFLGWTVAPGGITTGSMTITPAQYMVPAPGDTSGAQAEGFSQAQGNWSSPDEWFEYTIGTTTVPTVKAKPLGLVTVNARGDEMGSGRLSSGGLITGQDASGSAIWYGFPYVVCGPSDIYEEVWADYFTTPVTFPAMIMGWQNAATCALSRQPLNLTPAPGVVVNNLCDQFFIGCRTLPPTLTNVGLALTLVDANAAIPVVTPAGRFTDTITMGVRRTYSDGQGNTLVRDTNMVFARGAGLIAESMREVVRPTGAAAGSGKLNRSYSKRLTFYAAGTGTTRLGMAPTD